PLHQHPAKGGDREHPAARQLGRRDHLELRDQPFRRQGSRAGRGISRAAARRALRGLGRGGASPGVAMKSYTQMLLGRGRFWAWFWAWTCCCWITWVEAHPDTTTRANKHSTIRLRDF